MGNQRRFALVGTGIRLDTTSGPLDGDILTFKVATGKWTSGVPSSAGARIIGAGWDGGTAVITSPHDMVYVIPTALTITGVYIAGDAVGTATIDIWKKAFSGLPATNTNSILPAPLTISGAQYYSDTTLTGWTKVMSAGDSLTFHLTAVSTFQVFEVMLTCV
jgi:hypothetical protein